jgi:hypothetical protein
MSKTEKAPGLVWRKRRDGSQAAYWAARPALIKAGYLPKTVRLHYAPDDPALAVRCRALQAEMLAWASNNGQRRSTYYDGTFASLVGFYETHPDSPYHELRPATARTYHKTMALLMRHKGARRVDAVDASDVRRWYKELVEAHSKGWAYFTINVVKAVLSFGATKRIRECRELRAELREAKFQAAGRRKERLTYDQIEVFRKAAHVEGLGWMALCLTLQFGFGMRRRDVIGEWIDDQLGTDGIRNGKRLWRDGLTWAHVGADGVVRKLISKTMFTSELIAVHAIADYPDVEAELARIPLERRVGPIVINDRTGLPPTEAQCRHCFRLIARKAGIPDSIWNMDARAGASTEAYEAGATEEEAMALLTHSERRTSRGYLRDLTQQSRRAAAKRVASRAKE